MGLIPDFPADRPKVPEVCAMVAAYYAKPGNGCGGNLHCALDDGNLEKVFLEEDAKRTYGLGDMDGHAIAVALLAMTPTQRRKVYRTDRRDNNDWTPYDVKVFTMREAH